jgi:RNA polymerase sigma factor for flagellar operon FliA
MTTKTKKMTDQILDADNNHLRTAARRTYSRSDEQTSDELITRFLPLVHKVSQRISRYLKPPLNYEDLISAGTMGLIKAARDFDPAFQTEFITYAFIKIKGAILDELRAWSFVPATVEKQLQKAMEVTSVFLEQTRRMPSDEELAEKLNITVKKLYDVYEGARARNFVSIDENYNSGFSLSDCLSDSSDKTPDAMLEKNELLELLTGAITELNEKQRHIILLYYQQGLTMKQIAGVMKITEPRVSQIHASAIFALSSKLKKRNKNE